MDYEWDPVKAATNLRKHDIDFADAVSVFGDSLAITVMDDHPLEERYITVGMDAFGQVLVVVYLYRDEDCIRMISARRATRRERQRYEEEL